MKILSTFLVCSLAILFFNGCSSDEARDLIIGEWEWSSGSRAISPSGFERLHQDRNPNYLGSPNGFDWQFNADGSFESTYTISGQPSTFYEGNWNYDNGTLNLNYSQPANFEGLTAYQIPQLDDTSIDFRWTVEYLEFTDDQIEAFRNDGTLGSNGWTVDRDALLNDVGTQITSEITLHFVKS